MKRPAGPAARPTAPKPAAAKPAATTPPPAPEPRQQPARGPQRPAAGPGAAPTRAEPEALTEPIVLPAGAASDTPATDAPTKRRRPGGFSLPKRGVKAAAARDAPETSTPETLRQEPPLTARAARSRLRAARRARKQYERNEVRRFTSRSRHRRNLWLAAGGTVLALVAFVLVGVFSPLMALRTIEITGTNRIPAADVAQALEGQLGTPLPLLDLAEVKGQLSEFSLIRSYVTESRPPDTLVVRIVEREPVGAITSAAGFDLVDAAGVVIQSGPDRPQGYPLIDAAGGASGAGFQAAVAVVGALPEGIRGQLDSVTAATKDDVTLTLGGGARVLWGNAERSEYKALVLAALLVSHPVGSVTEYDVSSPDSAVVR
ncbi:cell division protein FtsQ [Cryobacterium sp. MP_3.1]|uniref:FtsQ-type POTRA domain-containing protein n=1 Tax=Cryobacterium sp. MP_3.1 TaxID=3071711 RepID=UPI002E04CA11|nr:cell division protein FtsQ [Cryobacterium sp. MP_3.1]